MGNSQKIKCFKCKTFIEKKRNLYFCNKCSYSFSEKGCPYCLCDESIIGGVNKICICCSKRWHNCLNNFPEIGWNQTCVSCINYCSVSEY